MIYNQPVKFILNNFFSIINLSAHMAFDTIYINL